MQYTTHYNLNLPEGTDIVNPLIQDNPNYSAIDTALYNNKLRVIGTATHTKVGTNHSITLADSDIPVFRFVATSDYNSGDSFTVDGVSVTARRADGTSMKNKAFVINSTVLAVLDGTLLNFIGLGEHIDASNVPYDNTSSGLSAGDVQDAIDELDLVQSVNTGILGIDAYKQNKIVTLIIALPSMSVTSGWNNIGYLPTALAPLTQLDFIGYDNDSVAHEHNTTQLRLADTGQLRLFTFGDHSTCAPHATITYLTA